MDAKSALRLKALGTGIQPDRVPVIMSLGGGYASKVLEIPSKEYFFNPALALEANTWTSRLLRDDSSPGYSIPEGICWDFGGELKFPDGIGKWPVIVKHPVSCEEDLEKLVVPDPVKAPAASRELEFVRLRYKAGYKGSFVASSPLRQAVQLVGVNTLLRWMVRKPHLVHLACQMTLEYSTRIAEMYVKEFGPEYWSVLVTYPVETNDLISTQQFKEFSVPHVIELHRRLKALGISKFKEHPCGRHRHNFWLWRDELHLPRHTSINVGTEVPIEEVGSYFGDHFVIGGNVSTSNLATCSPREIYEESKTIIEKMKYRAGGFILMPACAVSTAVPMANLAAMVQAAEDFGYYNES
ncbi:MAG: uroporphyrinogen decarboxylase family protein [Syntrophomonas sp.]